MFTFCHLSHFCVFLLFLLCWKQIYTEEQNDPATTAITNTAEANYTAVTGSPLINRNITDTLETGIDTLSDDSPANDTQHVEGTTSVVPVSVTCLPNETSLVPEYIRFCPSGLQCKKLGGECIVCDYNESCDYGKNVSVPCWPKNLVDCIGATNFTRTFECRYCFQTPHWLHTCTNVSGPSCKMFSAPRTLYQANCTVKNSVICLGRRRFYKMLPCNWTSGKRWSVALALSVTLGGFGVDRFYLGQWREGIGKLFSFGGLGVWTLIDVILVATGYVSPSDGSLYIF